LHHIPRALSYHVLDYDQYYASLAASTNVSARATPSASAPASSEYGDLNNDDEEEQKPSVEYLDSLNDYRKRSRSREDEGVKRTKQIKLEEEHVNGIAPESVQLNGFSDAVPMADEGLPPAPPVDDPMVYGMFIALCAAIVFSLYRSWWCTCTLL